MQLNYKHHEGPGEPLIVLHGLYGNQGNWAPQARQLAQDFNVFAFDARNHGQSPWADSMSLAAMAADVAETMQSLGLSSAHLLGHSMGGKTAMLLALTQPALVKTLSVVDIAPVPYTKATDHEIKALCGIELATITSRADADEKLSASIPQKFVRDFLLTNLQRAEDGSWRWRFNLPVLAASFRAITGWPAAPQNYAGPTLFIKGERSNYILPEHQAATLQQFPNAQLKVVNGSGHWVHSEKPEAVLRLIRNFLKDVSEAD
ncbi:MAG: alpha/beta fold hydrolase [Pseudomonadota bacterium]